jgi:hypothetical protein
MLQSKNKHNWKPLRRVSKKRQRSYIEYAKLRREYLENNPVCQCCGVNQATEVHHRRGRGIYLCDVRYFMAVDAGCHRLIEKKRTWAMNFGYSLDSIGKNNEPEQTNETLS